MPWLYVMLPAFLVVATPLFMALWCYWTGVWAGFRRLLVATLVVLVLFGLASWVVGDEVARHNLYFFFWGFGGLWTVLWGFGVPMIRRAIAGLPEVPRAASLRPRRLELFRGAFVWPVLAWGVIVILFAPSGLGWFAPGLGLAAILCLRPSLRQVVTEPEPLGGADPDDLARRYEAFRRRRVLSMYWLLVVLALSVSGIWSLLPAGPDWVGGVVGGMLGVWGGLFGTWSDAQRYLLRRQLSGAEPPGGRG